MLFRNTARPGAAASPLPCGRGEAVCVFGGTSERRGNLYEQPVRYVGMVAAVQGISLLIQAALQTTAAQETETNIWDRLQKAAE